ncbi:hypothetical protein VCHC17A1_2416B, partial [Vibrio cholerae HC-17A1]
IGCYERPQPAQHL